jgi:hypothetical protein
MRNEVSRAVIADKNGDSSDFITARHGYYATKWNSATAVLARPYCQRYAPVGYLDGGTNGFSEAAMRFRLYYEYRQNQ